MLLNSAISFSLESAFASRRGTVCKNEKANAAGNLTFAGTNRPRRGRNLTWTEDNRLIKVTEDLDPKYHSFYRYDAGGERTYKLVYNDVSSSYRPRYDFVGATMYPNPFLVITPEGYTKHYYAGTERIAAQIGKGKFNNVNSSIANADSTAAKLTAVNGIAPYLASYATPKFTYLNTLLALNTTAKEKYNTHTDHLGSSAWVTDSTGVAVQHLCYLPWGENWITQKTGNFNPTYTFSGKERDEETGYSYFGQRFYDSQLSFWLSVDPMRGKYPSLSPFVYCANNPIKLLDPNGLEITENYDEWKYNKTTGRLYWISNKDGDCHQTVEITEGNGVGNTTQIIDFNGDIGKMFDFSVINSWADGLVSGIVEIGSGIETAIAGIFIGVGGSTASGGVLSEVAVPLGIGAFTLGGYQISSGAKSIAEGMAGRNEPYMKESFGIDTAKSGLGLAFGFIKDRVIKGNNTKQNIANFGVSTIISAFKYGFTAYPKYKGIPSDAKKH